MVYILYYSEQTIFTAIRVKRWGLLFLMDVETEVVRKKHSVPLIIGEGFGKPNFPLPRLHFHLVLLVLKIMIGSWQQHERKAGLFLLL